ncbi:polysaccharide pyruvyl transferase family protein [Turicibacter sanguinis]|uniref:polysaccharide pyruvyl transferase family protein n=1 Tax=Turicibacter sanguinis TaxID=154288 RepID=UPI0012BC5241|nr:polysaccharide pyruvyl transferase family protein [Turicibacter sanguinis]MDB8545634.1 polysaccharide pyruvyl transferase family protein [Turicibacter sanguinis]MTO10806.1 polysaccharide pyruvyl transferase family protein [Turicibacter sanguinis]MTP48341.1 polysaccharide pyruvyl transferase family protein [Turicibacter sanguinis]MTP51060.1 polysaccharide pyruvyl transferase family protein [Turicibacter sanguinis]MTQ08342.1 polysaccharide pyruvyl transferase family protein [Turicibacter sang
MKRKVGISTVYTGFNYGSSLQAYASKVYLSKIDYEVELLSHKEGFIKGRDIRINKIAVMFLRTFWRPNLFKKTFLTYKNSLKKEIDKETKEAFLKFYDQKLKPSKYSWKELKEYARQNETLACVCGSDQIWNATNVYIDPIFYLRFAPKHKRIAYAPSFGKDIVPDYNQKMISKYISDIPYISVREEQGTKIVKELINREVTAVIDPTLLLNKEEWMIQIENMIPKPEEYMLVYFLDKPSERALSYINTLQEQSKLPLVVIPYKYQEFSVFRNVEYKNAGPEQFLDLVNNASFVCTDSFHGMIFSVNFNIPFYIFQRDYGTATDQSSRIISILNKLELQDRFIAQINKPNQTELQEVNLMMDFKKANQLLEIERIKSKNYIKQSLADIRENEK